MTTFGGKTVPGLLFAGGDDLGIKSIQRGVTATGIGDTITNQAIAAIDLAKTFLNIPGQTVASDNSRELSVPQLTSTTNIRFTRLNTSNVGAVSWEVIEFE